MKPDNNYGVYSLVFTPDSSRLLSAGADAKVRVWDLANEKEVIHFGEGYASICCVALSPDGKTAATGNTDNKIMLWGRGEWRLVRQSRSRRLASDRCFLARRRGTRFRRQ
jgi:WD40 repeat protein